MKQRGFSLLELLITLAIMAILFSVATPAYQHYLGDKRAQSAKLALQHLGLSISAYHLQHRTYRDMQAALDWPSVTGYQFTLQAADPQHFIISAEPDKATQPRYILTENGLQP